MNLAGDSFAINTAHATPILFVHGMWHAAWCWAENFLPFFAQNCYQASALSLRGHGKSEGRARLRWNTLADYVADVAEVAGRFAMPPILVGTSMGGMVVQKYLESHPAPAAVLLGSGPPGGVIPATLRTFRRQPLAFVKANLTLSMYPVVGRSPSACWLGSGSRGGNPHGCRISQPEDLGRRLPPAA